MGSILAFLIAITAAFLVEVNAGASEYGAYHLIGGIVFGVVMMLPAAAVAAFFAWLPRWHSRAAMWISGLCAAVVLPFATWFVFTW